MPFVLRFEIDASPERVWSALHDFDALVRCVPGAHFTGAASAAHLPVQLAVRLGPIPVVFSGHGAVAFDADGRGGRVVAQAVERLTGMSVAADARFDLVADADGGTTLAVRIDPQVHGVPAALTSGALVADLGRSLGKAFAARFRAQLGGRLPAADAERPIDGIAVLRQAVGARVGRLLGRLSAAHGRRAERSIRRTP